LDNAQHGDFRIAERDKPGVGSYQSHLYEWVRHSGRDVHHGRRGATLHSVRSQHAGVA
jgi:hypothetical protein